MWCASSKFLLQGVVFCLMLLLNAAQETEDPADGKANLEDYMRYTPAPMKGNETSAPFIDPDPAAPTSRPTQAPTTMPLPEHTGEAATSLPSSPPTEAPTNTPTDLPTTSTPSDSSSSAPTNFLSTSAPSEAPITMTPTGERTTSTTGDEVELTANDKLDPEESEAPSTVPSSAIALEEAIESDDVWGLFSEILEYQSSIGEVFVNFSLYSPNVTNLEMNFMKLKMGVCGSIDFLVCDQFHPIKEEGPAYCAVRDDVLLRDGASQSRQNPTELTDYDATVMALASTSVRDGTGFIHSTTSISWTTWRMSYNVMQLGPELLHYINNTYGPDLDKPEINAKGLSVLQQMMSVSMEQTLKDGVFQRDINDYIKDIMILASVVGEEVATYEVVMTPFVSSTHQGQEIETGEDQEGGGLMVVFFFAGLGVACFVIVTLLYFSFRSRRSVVRRKRTIVILDDTSKDCTDSQGSSSVGRVVVVDTQGALEEDAPQAQQEEENQHWEGSSIGATSSVSAGEVDLEAEPDADVESQWGRSMAQSSAYTGSISAITGVSGLEQSDTWSVGSMSIDLAEWG